jgi:parvulin-like peptidyl-prolyl isomerase
LAAAILAATRFSALGLDAGDGRTIPVDSYAATVNDRVILVSDIVSTFRSAQRVLERQYRGAELRDKLTALFADSQQALIERALVLEEWELQGTEIPDRAVDEQVEYVIRTQFNGDRSELMHALAEDQLTPKQWRDRLKEDLIFNVLRKQEVFDRVAVTPLEARSAYEANLDRYREPAEVKLRMITIPQGSSTQQMIENARVVKTARERIQFGEPFASVARELSQDSKAPNGGDWGWRRVADLRNELAEVAQTLPIGKLSHGIQAGDNYYLLMVEDRKEDRVVSFDDVQEDIVEQLRQDASKRLYEEWMRRLRSRHYVKILFDADMLAESGAP